MLGRGATLTLTKRNGGLLTAFLALFVTIVGRSFWRIFCFIVHARLSYKTAQDGLYHQRQAVLRNADASMGGLKSFIQLAWSWRKGSFQAWRRMTPLIGSTLILTIGFYVASVFSSQVSLQMFHWHFCTPSIAPMFCKAFHHPIRLPCRLIVPRFSPVNGASNVHA